MKNFFIYGANGYTGELIAREAVKRGLTPILGGRSRNKVEPLAKELDLTCRTFSLDDRKLLENTLKEVDFVIHCRSRGLDHHRLHVLGRGTLERPTSMADR